MDDGPNAGREIFIHNLKPGTTDETLYNHFSGRYRSVEGAFVVPGKTIGLVLFKDPESASEVLRESHQFIDGWPASCRLSSQKPQWENHSGRKVVVWGFQLGLSTERFVEIFRRFGEIEVGPLGLDKETGALKPTVVLVYKTESGAKAATKDGVLNYPESTFYCRMYTETPRTVTLAASLALGQGDPGRILNPGPAFLGQHYGGSTGNAAVGAGYHQNRQFQAQQFRIAQQQLALGAATTSHPFLRRDEYWRPHGFDSRPQQSHNAQLQRVAGRGGGGTGVYLGGAQGATAPMMALPPSMRGYRTAGFGSLNAQQQVAGSIAGGGGSGPIVQGAPGPRPQYQHMGGYNLPVFNGQQDFRNVLPFGSGGVTSLFSNPNAQQQVAGSYGGGGGSGPAVLGAPSPWPQYQQMGGYNPPGFNGRQDFQNAQQFGSGGETSRISNPNAQQQVAGSSGDDGESGPVVQGAPSPSSQYQHMGGYNLPGLNSQHFRNVRRLGSNLNDLLFGGGGGRSDRGGDLGGRYFGQRAPTWRPPWIGGYRTR